MEEALIINKLIGKHIAVVGDLMLDHFVWGNVRRISPEAPVPVVDIESESFHLGGAANVALNLASLGINPLLLGVIGKDQMATILRNSLKEWNVADNTVLSEESRRTTVKTRIIAGSQQVVRTDWESREDLTETIELLLLEALKEEIPKARALILSDYAKGTLTPRIIKLAIKLAQQSSIPILVDPKSNRFKLYSGVTVVTPNLAEAERFAGVSLQTNQDIEQAGQAILQELSSTAVIITRGEQGMTLLEKGQNPIHIPAVAREVFDVSGAGDTVIATLALALASGSNFNLAVHLANRAAGIVVGKLGTATVKPEEL